MHKLSLVFILFGVVPNICWALSDACTNPDEYTIERRCYVTNDVWQRAPYKHVLKMQKRSNGLVFCTANMVKGKIVTARHCIENNNMFDVDFVAFDGRKIQIGYLDHLSKYPNEYYQRDIAILEPSLWGTSFVTENSINVIDDASGEINNKSFINVGCGGLKILSDKEIHLFKQAYSEFLKNPNKQTVPAGEESDVLYNPIIDNGKTANLIPYLGQKGFLNEFTQYLQKYGLGSAEDLFHDSYNMKMSLCTDFDLSRSLGLVYSNCKGWHGNSGGGVYRVSGVLDKNNFIKTNICNSDSCGFLGVYVQGLSLISSDPKKHLSPIMAIEPIIEIDRQQEDE